MNPLRLKIRLALLAPCLGWLLIACGTPQAVTEKPESESRLAKAEAMFKERCKTAGEKIYRTADNVEGIYLMKLRPREINYGDQYRMDDPYGRDVGGDGYIINFLLGKNANGSLVEQGQVWTGYPYVEALDPQDGKRYRYTGAVREVTRISSPLIGGDGKAYTGKAFILDKAPAVGPQPRYGVTYDDISTREERDYWIAGSSLKVIDLKTKEVMAERIGYMMDRGQGSRAGGRSPWLLAADNACPAFPVTPGGQPFKMDQTRNFIEKTLSIKQEK